VTGDVAVELGQPAEPGEPAGGGAAGGSARSGGGTPAAEVPVIRIERGNPTPEQLAALTVVLSAASGGSEPPPPRRTLWTARSRFARPRPAVGPGGWRAPALPR
jgi:hypothetical protein